MKFENRNHAGKLLVGKIREKNIDLKNSIILALPRGGVPVAYEIARELEIPLSLLVTKKLAPLSKPEFGFGAIAPDGTALINRDYLLFHRISNQELEEIKKLTLKKVKDRIVKYNLKDGLDLTGKISIIVDDGAATGYTAMVAGKFAKKKGSIKTILAIPVAPENSIERIKQFFDIVICYQIISERYFAVGAYYHDFHQVQDKELFTYLDRAEQEALIGVN